jgi:hypothetical protein
VILSDFDSDSSRLSVSDAGNLVIRDAGKKDDAEYVCQAMNIVGSRRSEPARLNVLGEPTSKKNNLLIHFIKLYLAGCPKSLMKSIANKYSSSLAVTATSVDVLGCYNLRQYFLTKEQKVLHYQLPPSYLAIQMQKSLFNPIYQRQRDVKEKKKETFALCCHCQS